MGELAPLLERVMSTFGQPATIAEKWAAELTKAWVTTVEDAAQLLALECEEKRNGVSKLSEGWTTKQKKRSKPPRVAMLKTASKLLPCSTTIHLFCLVTPQDLTPTAREGVSDPPAPNAISSGGGPLPPSAKRHLLGGEGGAEFRCPPPTKQSPLAHYVNVCVCTVHRPRVR